MSHGGFFRGRRNLFKGPKAANSITNRIGLPTHIPKEKIVIFISSLITNIIIKQDILKNISPVFPPRINIKGGGVHQWVHDVWSTMFNQCYKTLTLRVGEQY